MSSRFAAAFLREATDWRKHMRRLRADPAKRPGWFVNVSGCQGRWTEWYHKPSGWFVCQAVGGGWGIEHHAVDVLLYDPVMGLLEAMRIVEDLVRAA